MIEVSGKRVVVVGLGASGIASARLCARRGARVVATDIKSADRLGPDVAELVAHGVQLVLGGHGEARLADADLVVISPGVPRFPELLHAEGARVPIIGEVELAVSSLASPPPPIVAIGGTNGKSTTTTLVGAILEAQGLRTFTGGNLGEPLANHTDESFEVVVLEVSSFQMERVRTFRPRVAALLNITPDHLDRYPTFQVYADAKGNAFTRQTKDDLAVIPVSDPLCEQQARRGGARLATFGPGGVLDVTADSIVDTRTGDAYPRSRIALAGGHNALNVAAAILAARELGATPDTIRLVLQEFRGLPHRMALIREIDGVRYYNDSKGTNVGAAVTALEGMREPRVVLIAGGRDKGGSYAPLVAALLLKGRGAVVVGEAADAIAKAIGDAVPIRHATSMDAAVRAAAALAERGDAVLLSPACASYDMFRDYEHRGDEFVRAIDGLAEDT